MKNAASRIAGTIAGTVLSTLVLAAPAYASSVTASISLSRQTMTVSENGFIRYQWKVSTARKGYVTPMGHYTAKSTELMHRSRKYDNSPMPYSVFFKGGYAIHGTREVRHLGSPASHGCVRLLTENAATFFSLARSVGLENTRIVISQ